MSMFDTIYILTLPDTQLRAGICIGNLLTQDTPQDRIELTYGYDGRNASFDEVINAAVCDGFEEFLHTDLSGKDVTGIAIRYSWMRAIREIAEDKKYNLLMFDDCTLLSTYWDIHYLVQELDKRELNVLQLGRWTPATHKFKRPDPMDKDWLPRITTAMSFGDYGTIVSPKGAKLILDTMAENPRFMPEMIFTRLEGEGIYSVHPSVIGHEHYKDRWTE